MIINRPKIAQVEAAPVGSIIEYWRNKDQAEPQRWIKRDTLWWVRQGGLPQMSAGLTLTINYKWRLITKDENK